MKGNNRRKGWVGKDGEGGKVGKEIGREERIVREGEK